MFKLPWKFREPKVIPTKKLNLSEFQARMYTLVKTYAPYTRAHLPIFMAVSQPSARVWAQIATAQKEYSPLVRALHEKHITQIEVPDREYDYLEDELNDIIEAMKKVLKNAK